MSIQRIDHPASNTHGWQARVHLAPGRRLARFFADDSHGGQYGAHQLAMRAEMQLQRRVRAMRQRG